MDLDIDTLESQCEKDYVNAPGDEEGSGEELDAELVVQSWTLMQKMFAECCYQWLEANGPTLVGQVVHLARNPRATKKPKASVPPRNR